MSRIIVFGLDGKSMGEVHANCPRGWAINEGGSTTVNLTAQAAAVEWLQLGRMVLVEHPRLPAWSGMIDTPWTATLPVKMTLYNAGYLLHVRSIEHIQSFHGNTAQIAAQMVAHAHGYMPVQMGDTDHDDSRSAKMNAAPIWEQMVDLVKKAGMEMRLRPGRNAENKLAFWLDIKKMLGWNTGFLLHDGTNHNIEITTATVDFEIFNRVEGISSTGSAGSELYSKDQQDKVSMQRYMERVEVVQFSNAADVNALNKLAAVELQNKAYPKLSLTVNILDVGDTFQYLDLGNQFIVQASGLYLPGGVQGWRGPARITAMAYDEEKNVVSATMIGDLS